MSGLSRATINYAERGRVEIGADALLTLMSLLGLGIEPITDSGRALRLLAQSASPSNREPMPASALERILISGVIPDRWLAHVATLLDGASDRMLLQGIREVAARSGASPERIWRTAQLLAERTESLHPRWRHAA